MNILWPPEYTLKKQARARQIKLKSSEEKGLEIVVPLRFNAKNITEILENNKEWIIKHLTRIHVLQQKQASEPLPLIVHFPIINQFWKIDYVSCDTSKLILLLRPNNELVFLGKIEKKACITLLLRWCRKQANIHLPQMLIKISQKSQLSFGKVTIRSPKSRWGSCSQENNINLNFKLIFLPTHLVHHILIHELCHTIHHNHSKSFWQLVARHDLNWLKHNKEIRKIHSQLPLWCLN